MRVVRQPQKVAAHGPCVLKAPPHIGFGGHLAQVQIVFVHADATQEKRFAVEQYLRAFDGNMPQSDAVLQAVVAAFKLHRIQMGIFWTPQPWCAGHADLALAALNGHHQVDA